MNHEISLLAVGGLTLFLVSCESTEMKSLLEREEYYTRQLEIYEDRVDKADRKIESENEKLKEAKERSDPAMKSEASREKMLAQMREMIGGLSSMESSLIEKTALLEAYKAAFRPKSLPDGSNLGDFTLSNGQTFRAAVLRASTPEGLSIGHSGGFSHVPVSQLPDSIRSQFLRPPTESSSIPDPYALLARKPKSIKSNAEYEAERERAMIAAETARQEKLAQIDAARSEMLETRAREQEASRQETMEREARTRAYLSQVSEVDKQISTLERSLADQEFQKQEMIYANQQGTIRVAPADFAKRLTPFDEKVKALRAQILELQQRKAAIPKP